MPTPNHPFAPTHPSPGASTRHANRKTAILLLQTALLFCLLAHGLAAITDLVTFDTGPLTDRFAINVQTAPSPYSLAANGLGGTQGVDITPGGTGDATLVYKLKGYNLAAIPSLTVSYFVRKQASTAATPALSLALVGATATRLSSYDVAGTEDSFMMLRLGRTVSALHFETQYKTGSSNSLITANAGANLNLVDGNWYQVRATFQRLDATSIRVSGSIFNASADGVVGTMVSNFSPASIAIPDLAGDSQVWVALRGYADAGSDAWDNLTITADGVNDTLPAVPTGFDARAQPGYAVRLTWTDASDNEDGFVLSRAPSAAGPFTDIATLLPNVTSYLDTSAPSLSRVYYRLRAYNSAGSSAFTGTAAAITQRTIYRWRNVATGGGGYVTGIFLHPLERDLVYIRTDVGGWYRWDATNTRWLPLTEHLPLASQNFYGGESLALDPQNPNIVYLAAGKYADTTDPAGALFKSTDRGATWTQLSLSGIKMGSNEAKRQSGERLVVSPHGSNVLLFGTRNDGLWRSTDAGASWSKLTTFPGVLTALTGINSVVFDSQTAGVAYAAAYNDGVYRTTDNGTTWSALPGGPTQVNRMAVSHTGTLFATHQAGVAIYTGGAWSNSVPGGTASPLYGLSVNPANANDVLVAEGEADATRIWRTTNGGANWSLVNRTHTSTVPWWTGSMRQMAHLSNLQFDPQVPGRVWTADWFGVWRTENIDADPAAFTNYEVGHEELVSFCLAAPASGPLLFTGVADCDGFAHTLGLESFPPRQLRMATSTIQDTYGMAVSDDNPARIVRCIGNRTGGFRVTTSTDSGETWSTSTWPTTVMPMRVALSAGDPTNYVVIASAGTAQVTLNSGATWQAVTGLPAGPTGPWVWHQALAADRQTPGTFYYYSAGKVYRSIDRGQSFAQVNTTTLTNAGTNLLKTLPGTTGDLWLNLDTNGLWRSTDGGVTFTKITPVTRAYLYAFGKAPTGSTTPALYLYGKIDGSADGLFRSHDLGATWTELSDPTVAIGNLPNTMEASMQQYGLVFVGTNGRGIYYGEPLPVVSISATIAQAAEWPLTPGEFTLTRAGNNATALTVPLQVSGSASQNLDYATAASPISIGAGATSTAIAVTPQADNLAEGPETVTFTLQPGLDYLLGSADSATLTIADKPFDAWRFTHGLAASALGADTDGDGLPDLLEYSVGGDPRSFGGSATPGATLDGGGLSLTYRRLYPAELRYTVEVSADLQTWSSGPAFVEETSQPDGITIIARDLIQDGTRRFIRLRVTLLPLD